MEAWASAPRVPPVDTSPTPTADAPHTASKDPTPTTHAPMADAAPNTTPQGSGIPTSPPQAEHNVDGKEEPHNSYYRRDDAREYQRDYDHYSPDYTRRD